MISVSWSLTRQDHGEQPFWMAITVAAMATLYNNVSVGNDQPTVIITGQAQYEAYEALLDGQIRYTDTDMADGGFQNLMF